MSSGDASLEVSLINRLARLHRADRPEGVFRLLSTGLVGVEKLQVIHRAQTLIQHVGVVVGCWLA